MKTWLDEYKINLDETEYACFIYDESAIDIISELYFRNSETIKYKEITEGIIEYYNMKAMQYILQMSPFYYEINPEFLQECYKIDDKIFNYSQFKLIEDPSVFVINERLKIGIQKIGKKNSIINLYYCLSDECDNILIRKFIEKLPDYKENTYMFIHNISLIPFLIKQINKQKPIIANKLEKIIIHDRDNMYNQTISFPINIPEIDGSDYYSGINISIKPFLIGNTKVCFYYVSYEKYQVKPKRYYDLRLVSQYAKTLFKKAKFYNISQLEDMLDEIYKLNL